MGAGGKGQTACVRRALLQSWLKEGPTRPFREGGAHHREHASLCRPLGNHLEELSGDFCVGREAGWSGSRAFLVLTFEDFNSLKSRDSSKIPVGLHQDSMIVCLG